MSLRVHDDVARQYNSDDGIIAAKNQAVLEGLTQRYRHHGAPLRVADLGVGDGAQLQMLATLGLPLTMTGLDVSPAMLRLAAQRVPLTTVLAPAERAAAHLPHQAFDLVLAHFVLAYVPPRALLREVRQLLAPGGVLSLAATVTEGGAPFYDALETTFRRSWNPLRRVIAWAADRALARSHMPADFAAMEADLQACGLTCLVRRTLRMPVRFDTPQQAYRFGIEEGWAVNILAVPGVPLGVAKWFARWGLDQCRYPFEVTQVVEILEVGVA